MQGRSQLTIININHLKEHSLFSVCTKDVYISYVAIVTCCTLEHNDDQVKLVLEL